MHKLHELYIKDRSIIKTSFLATFILGIIAHAFGIFQISPVHDTLWEFTNTWEHKISLGRFLAPLIRTIMGETIILPVISAVVSLLCIFLSVVFVCKMFHITHPIYISLIAGISVTNLTVTSLLAAFTHDLAGDMIALLLSVLAVYLLTINSNGVSKAIIPVILTILSLSIYQAYFAVSVTLVFIYSVYKLLNGDMCNKVFRIWLRSIIVLAISAIIYACITYLITSVSGITQSYNAYNSVFKALDIKSIFLRIPRGIWMVIRVLFLPNSAYAVKANSIWGGYLVMFINVTLLFTSAFLLIKGYINKKLSTSQAVFTATLLILTPLAMSCIFLLLGVAYILLAFPCWYFYLLVLVIFFWAKENQIVQKSNFSSFFIVALSVIILLNIQLSNTVYTSKKLEKDGTLSTMTRVVSAIEAQDGYEYGKTPVAIVGIYYKTLTGVPDTDPINQIDGMHFNGPISYYACYPNYFRVVLQYDINLCGLSDQQMEFAKGMPIFPAKDSVCTIDGIIVVKLGEID